MKKILKLSLLLFIVQFSYAQQEKIENIGQYFNSNFRPSPFFIYYYKDIDNNFIPFIGNWIYQNGNQTFILTLWKVEKVPGYPNNPPKYYIDKLRGHYKLVQNYGQPNEQVIYTSQINIGNSTTPWETIVMGNQPIEAYKMSGFVYDVTGVVNPAYPLGVKGQLNMEINPANLNIAQWKVTLPMGMRGSDEPKTFTIPTNVTLTKVN